VRVRLRLIRDPTRSENCDAAAAPPAVLEMMSAFVLPTRRHVRPDWKLRSGGIHVVFPAARFRPAKVSRFVELLVESERERTSSGTGRRV
jgi:hypothetical protein